MIFLRKKSHGEIIRVCMRIFTIALIPLRNKKKIQSNSQYKYLTLLPQCIACYLTVYYVNNPEMDNSLNWVLFNVVSGQITRDACWKVKYVYWEFDCIFLFLKVVVNIPIQTLIISPWLLFRKMIISQLELGLPVVRPDISKLKFMKIRSRGLNQFSWLKLKQQAQNVHSTINRYLRPDEFVCYHPLWCEERQERRNH